MWCCQGDEGVYPLVSMAVDKRVTSDQASHRVGDNNDRGVRKDQPHRITQQLPAVGDALVLVVTEGEEIEVVRPIASAFVEEGLCEIPPVVRDLVPRVEPAVFFPGIETEAPPVNQDHWDLVRQVS